MLRLVRSVHSTLSSLGVGNGLSYLFAEAIHRISRRRVRIVKYRLLVQPIGDGIGLRGHRGRDLHVREVKMDDCVLQQIELDERIILSRFEQGGRCLVATREDRLAGFLWWTEGPYCEDEVRSLFVPQPEGEAVWDFGVHVAPQHRGTLAFARLWDVATRDLYARGFRRTCSRVSAFNTSSLTAHQRLGAQIVGTRWYVCVGSAQFSIARDTPRIHFSLSEESRPVIPVPAVPTSTGTPA